MGGDRKGRDQSSKCRTRSRQDQVGEDFFDGLGRPVKEKDPSFCGVGESFNIQGKKRSAQPRIGLVMGKRKGRGLVVPREG